ncbi:MAG: T9SS type A sorting domain-containing protein [Calditrichaeota bacterium]|nr:T9SS type A sorting domain-containing protein [Calditrichota bacterium]
MRVLKSILILTVVVFLCGWLNFSYAETTVSPLGFTNVNDEQDVIETILTLTNNGENAVDYSVNVRAAEWGGNDEERGPLRDERGGPDDFENVWVDHREGDCPAYNWIDITELEDTQHIEDVLDDSFHGMYDLGFEFPYYGEVYNEIGLHANGWCSFIERFQIIFHYPAWGPLPNDQPDDIASSPPPTLMAVMYQDLDPGTRTGEIYYWTDGRSTAIITWDDMAHWQDEGQEDGEHWTFQIILNRSGLIKYQYAQIGDDDPNRPSVMVGMQNEARDTGFTMCNDDFEYLEAEGVVAFGPPDAWVPWLAFDPADGEIEGGESAEVTATVNFEDLEEGVYLAEMIVTVDDDGIQEFVVPIIASMDYPVGDVEGTITDEANGDAVEGASIVFNPSGLTRFSDEEGNFEVINMPEGDYELVCIHPDYHTFVIDLVEVMGGEFSDGSMELLHSECNINRDDIALEVAPGESTETSFTVTNDGNAPLTYTNHRRIPEAPDVDPWELRDSVPAGVITEDARVHGTVFIDDHFFASGANDGEAAIYVLNRDQELVDQYAQLGESRYGYKDLATDGETIWGSGERIIFGFTLDGEEVNSFDCGISPCNNLAWDSDRDILWASGTTTEISGFDREGNQVAEIGRHNYRVYGLAYWPDDPDGYQLYIFHKINDVGDLMIAKIDIDNDRAMDVDNLFNVDGGVAQGCFISNQYDIYSWVFMGVANSGAEDRIDIWHMDFRLDWFAIDPTEGVIEPGQSQDFDVVLDAAQLPAGEYEGEFVFDHDGTNGESILPVMLVVSDGPVVAERTIEMDMGWNLISTNVQPDPDDIREIMVELVEQDLLEIMKNGVGQFYNPQFNFNNIPGWNVAEGYQVKLVEAADLTVRGMSVMGNEPIPLGDGWNMISYFPRVEIDAIVALSGIVDELLIAKDGAGRFYSPPFNFSNMGNLSEGNGYQLKLENEIELVYQLEQEEFVTLLKGKTKFLTAHPSTDHNMSLLVLDPTGVDGEIGVYSGDNLVGSGVLSYGNAGIAIWGDDPTTEAIDGAVDTGRLTLVLLEDGRELDFGYTTVLGSDKYEADGFWVIELSSTSSIPFEFGIQSAYPNPFNNKMSLSYSLEEAGVIDIAVIDISGRRVNDLFKGNQTAGLHSIQINGMDYSSGVYFVELRNTGKVAKQKVVLLK